ncbi:MAG TPA: diguanylate cyclase, partial [Telluria sp.]|nr:diguanylate cyclase [Telluria sp.]
MVAQLLALLGAPACACDGFGRITASNPSFEQLAGPAANREFQALFVPGEAAQTTAHLRRAFEKRHSWNSWVAGGAAVAIQSNPLPQEAGPGALFVFTRLPDAPRQGEPVLLEQRAIFDYAPVGIAFVQLGVIKGVNPRMAEMFRYRQEDLPGMEAVKVFISSGQLESFLDEAFAVLRTGGLFEKAEFPFVRGDGTHFWGRVRASAVDPANRAAGTIWMIEDVTEARQTLIEVQAIMNNASLSIVFTRNRTIVRYNRGFADMFGYPNNEAVGMPVRGMYGSDKVYDEIGAVALPMVASGKAFQQETEMVRRDGSRLWVQLIGYLVNPADPDLGMIWIIEDRSRHKRDEESLRNAVLENQAILDNAVLGIAVVEDGRTLRCNAKMEELFRYAPGTINGVTVRSLYPNDRSWMEARRQTARDFSAGRVHMAEYELVRTDGSTFWARLSGRLFDVNEQQGRSVWLVDDVTARREAAEAVARARDELEVRVQERTAELAGANALLQAEIVERRQAEARVHHMAYHDTLTGLPNRALLSDRLERAMLAAQRSERKLAVMFIDLDRFKNINDSLGHQVGDLLLLQVAGRLQETIRNADIAARLGGDEFVVVATLDTEDNASCIAQNLLRKLTPVYEVGGREVYVGASIGISVYPDDGTTPETLLKNADIAMYNAKKPGVEFCFYSTQMNQKLQERTKLEFELWMALEREEFFLEYQPIVDARTGRIAAVEALVRWMSPELGRVMPDAF